MQPRTAVDHDSSRHQAAVSPPVPVVAAARTSPALAAQFLVDQSAVFCTPPPAAARHDPARATPTIDRSRRASGHIYTHAATGKAH